MKPMNSSQLDKILDILASIGARKVQKNKSLLSSINMNDEMIRIAAKNIVLDPIEKKLRAGYIYPISREKEYTVKMSAPFTERPPTLEESKKEEKTEKKYRQPGSAMGKYPSGSETTTPYVGEQHGGDQTPAACTLSSRKNNHFTRIASSVALKEIISELKKEDQIFVELRDIVMKLNQKGQQGQFNVEELCKTLAKEGITLIKTAGEEVPQGSFDPEQVKKGIQVEMEHQDTIDAFRNQVEQGNDLPNEKVAEMIAHDHLTEDPEYYTKLQAMEATASIYLTAKSVAEIKDDLNHARESRSYAIERMGEKDLTPEEKEKYHKTKIKWEKAIDKFDRELSRAMKAERKEEREKDKAEKLEKAQSEMVEQHTAGVHIVKADMGGPEVYEQDDRVEFVSSSSPYTDVKPSDKGTVLLTDDAGVVHVNWDNGTSSQVMLDGGDIIKKLSEEGNTEPPEAIGFVIENLTVTAADPTDESSGMGFPAPEFNEEAIGKLKEFLNPVEYEEVQRLLDLRTKSWETIIEREERNINEGEQRWENIDYSETELYTQKIKQYLDLANSRKEKKTTDVLDIPVDKPEETMTEPAPKGEEMPGAAPEMTGLEKGTMDKRPLPEFATARHRFLKKSMPEKKAVMGQKFPDICKNCKALIVPSGYTELGFMDHKLRPFCSVGDEEKRVGFRYAYARECRAYDAILKEVDQRVDKPSETIFKKLEDRGEKPILKKEAAYEDKPKNEPATIDTDEENEERAKKVCEKCFKAGYFMPRGTYHPVHDYHGLWMVPYTDVIHDPKGVCLPATIAGQSDQDSGQNQFGDQYSVGEGKAFIIDKATGTSTVKTKDKNDKDK